jgi:hypothetical protein
VLPAGRIAVAFVQGSASDLTLRCPYIDILTNGNGRHQVLTNQNQTNGTSFLPPFFRAPVTSGNAAGKVVHGRRSMSFWMACLSETIAIWSMCCAFRLWAVFDA